jgi:WD40 repeat protein
LKKSPILLLLSLSILFCSAYPFRASSTAIDTTTSDRFSDPSRSERIDPERISQEITVRIEGASNGSGAIVERNGNTYYVLTNAHVFKKAGSYMVITPDGNRYPIDDTQVIKLPGMDLALFFFRSPLNYSIATLGDDRELSANQPVYVSGWPRAGTMMRQRIFISTKGKLTEIDSQLSRGYSLTYSNLVRVGMSGGPILNDRGQLIGIHGLARLMKNTDKVVSSGIKIGKFLQWHAFNPLPQPTIPESEPTVAANPLPIDEEKATFPPSIPIKSTIDFAVVKTLATTKGSLTSVALSDREIVSECSDRECDEPYQPLVSSSSDGSIFVWNLSDGHLLKTWRGHDRTINKITISPDGKLLATASDDKKIKLWDIRTGELLHTLKRHKNAVTSLAFSPDGQTLVSGSWDKTIKIWQVKTGQLLKTLTKYPNLVTSLTISPDGKILASGAPDGNIRLWNLKTGKIAHTFKTNALSVLSLAISRDSRKLVSGGADGTIEVWDLIKGKKDNQLIGHTDGVWSIAIAKNDRTLVSGSWDKTIKLWDLDTGKLERTLNGHSDYVMAVSLSPDDLTLVSGAWDNQIDIWKRIEIQTLDSGNGSF